MSNVDETFMRLAIDLSKQGEGFVEPNPMVGCVLVQDNEVIGQGFHQEFGGPHAEVNALNSAFNAIQFETGKKGVCQFDAARGPVTAYVTLEPCSHTGKTGPCASALINAGISRVVIACSDPNPLVAGKGTEQLRNAGIEVTLGILQAESREVLAPYLKCFEQSKPWVIAKWAMTLDGRIATRTGDSKWISSEASRARVHSLRARVDAVMVGIGTAIADDPMLNARNLQPDNAHASRSPAIRVIVDSTARISLSSKLVQTAEELPTLIAVGPKAKADKIKQLRDCQCVVYESDIEEANQRLVQLLSHLQSQQITNILVEGGGQLLGSLNDLGQIDEVHCFIGPKLAGGSEALSPVLGAGFDMMNQTSQLKLTSVRHFENDVYIIGRTQKAEVQ
ncbi:MAG: bifunctional diaminohydroxyphosphoribosylaminopyrimidine deaminase/5-amino-6-(5-phosphoribosylamino)uracil reductase RibD [Mariniblastus sp.]|nr:bifunctional diaminohydroxyphosphoribosylaminopyrimidine deaminase/5-amino-6-(5-phosphoribosylamino)uracil reductase RibD [Mariniblastus sp.]